MTHIVPYAFLAILCFFIKIVGMKTYYQAAGVRLAGNIEIGEDVSLWYNAVLRTDETTSLRIGRGTNIQDQVMIHADFGHTVEIGEYVTVGHSAILHGCVIGNSSLIGMGAIVMDNAVIPPYSLVAAGALVSQGKTYPERCLIMGAPAKAVRPLTEEECRRLEQSARHYIKEAAHSLPAYEKETES